MPLLRRKDLRVHLMGMLGALHDGTEMVTICLHQVFAVGFGMDEG